MFIVVPYRQPEPIPLPMNHHPPPHRRHSQDGFRNTDINRRPSRSNGYKNKTCICIITTNIPVYLSGQMFLLYFVLVSSSVTFLMNQIRQSSYRIDFHEFTEQLPRYMMMNTNQDIGIGLHDVSFVSNELPLNSRTNSIAGNDMRLHVRSSEEDSMESFRDNFLKKKMLDYLEHSSQDKLIKTQAYQEYSRKERHSIAGPCLQAGTWPDLNEFDFI